MQGIQKLDRFRNKNMLSRNRFNPESFSSTLIPANPQPKPGLKRCQSALTIRNQKHNPSMHSSSLQKKYKVLKQNYKNLAAEIANKNEEFGKQKLELKRLENQHQQNRQKIHLLRGMLGFLEKHDISTQTVQSMGLEKTQPHTQSHKILKAYNSYQSEMSTGINEKLISSATNIWSPKTSKMRNSRKKQLKEGKKEKVERSPSCELYKQKYQFKRSIRLH